MEDEGITLALKLLRNSDRRDFPSFDSTTALIAEELNKYLQLVNECNYIFSVAQQYEHGLGSQLQSLKNSRPFLLITSQELAYMLAVLMREGENAKVAMIHTQRKASSQGKGIKMPSMNSAVIGKKKNSFFSRNEYFETEM